MYNEMDTDGFSPPPDAPDAPAEETPTNSDIIIYILCPNEQAKLAAIQTYCWTFARFLVLPEENNPFLESVIFMDHLHANRHEWIDKSFVGCIAHSALEKQPLLARLDELIDIVRDEFTDFCAFLYRGDPLISTAEKLHPGFEHVWDETWKRLGWSRDVYMSKDTPSFYCNYFLTTPRLMAQYCAMMTYLKFWFDADETYRQMMMIDSAYDDRGPPGIAKITVETKHALFGRSFYPMSIFVCERMPCVFFNKFATKKLLIR